MKLRHQFLRLRGPEADLGEGGGAGGGTGGTPPAAVATPQRPDGLADEFWDDKAGVKWDAIQGQLKEYSDLRGTFVQKPEEIDWSLPNDLDPDNPDIAWEINKDDPMLKGISEVLVQNKASQGLVSGLAKAYAAQQVAQYKEAKAALEGERKKLGDKWQERHDAAKAFVAKAVGEKRAEAFATTWVTAEQVEIIEALAKLAAGPSAPAGVQTTTPESESKGRVFYGGMNGNN